MPTGRVYFFRTRFFVDQTTLSDALFRVARGEFERLASRGWCMGTHTTNATTNAPHFLLFTSNLLWLFVGCRCKGPRYLIFLSIGRQREWAYGSHFDSLLLLRRGNVVRIVTDWHRGAMTCCLTRLVRRIYEMGAFIPLQVPGKDFVVFASARGTSYMKVLLFLQPDLA